MTDHPLFIWALCAVLVSLAFWACWLTGSRRKKAAEAAERLAAIVAHDRIEADASVRRRQALQAKQTNHNPAERGPNRFREPKPKDQRGGNPSNRRPTKPEDHHEKHSNSTTTTPGSAFDTWPAPTQPVDKRGGDVPFRSGRGGDFGGGGATASWAESSPTTRRSAVDVAALSNISDEDDRQRLAIMAASFAAGSVSNTVPDSALPPAPSPAYEDCRREDYSTPAPSPAYEPPPPPPPPAPSPSYESYSSPSPSPSYDSSPSPSPSYDSGSSSSSYSGSD